MEASNFSQERGYNFSFKGSTLKLFREGIGLYTDMIKKWQKPSNKKIEEILDQNERLAKWLERKIVEEDSDWKLVDCYNITGKTIQILKSTLPYLRKIKEAERFELKEENPPEEAFEGIDSEIQLIDEAIAIKGFDQIPDLPLMGDLTSENQDVSKQSKKIIKTLKSNDYWIRSSIDGKDEHLFIGKRDKTKEKVHLIFDRETGEIRIDRKDLPPDKLLEEVYTIAKIKNGPTIKKTKTSLEFIDESDALNIDEPVDLAVENLRKDEPPFKKKRGKKEFMPIEKSRGNGHRK